MVGTTDEHEIVRVRARARFGGVAPPTWIRTTAADRLATDSCAMMARPCRVTPYGIGPVAHPRAANAKSARRRLFLRPYASFIRMDLSTWTARAVRPRLHFPSMSSRCSTEIRARAQLEAQINPAVGIKNLIDVDNSDGRGLSPHWPRAPRRMDSWPQYLHDGATPRNEAREFVPDLLRRRIRRLRSLDGAPESL